jgi:hypothetical protein
MVKFKPAIVGAAAAAVIAFLPLTPAMAAGHGFAQLYPWGLGRGIFGAAVALATLPLAIASAVVSSAPAAAPYPASGVGGGYSYAPRAVYPPPAYYGGRPGYYPPPRAYAAPRPYYAPRPAHAAPGYYRSGGPAYRH